MYYIKIIRFYLKVILSITFVSVLVMSPPLWIFTWIDLFTCYVHLFFKTVPLLPVTPLKERFFHVCWFVFCLVDFYYVPVVAVLQSQARASGFPHASIAHVMRICVPDCQGLCLIIFGRSAALVSGKEFSKIHIIVSNDILCCILWLCVVRVQLSSLAVVEL